MLVHVHGGYLLVVCGVSRILFASQRVRDVTPLLVGFTDSDWADDPDDRKSTVGYVFSLGSGPIT